jgi:plastocyanin
MILAVALVLISALAASAADFNVTVGANNQLVFDPTSVTVQNGDTVHFELYVASS